MQGTETEQVRLELEPTDGPGRGFYYRATLRYQGRRATFPFSTGEGWEREPVAREVLESVCDEAASVRDADDVDEALRVLLDEFGADGVGDSPRKLARELLALRRKLERLLGDDFAAAVDDPAGFSWSVTDDPPPLTPAGRWSPMAREWEGRIGVGEEGPVLLSVALRATEKGLEFAAQASTPHGGGQYREALEGLETFAPGWDAAKVARFREVWDRWHLNTMRSACEHQRARGWTYNTHAGQDCPECGYRIGSAWLAEPLPADVVSWLESLAPELAAPDAAETFRFYVGAGQRERFALEATYPDLVGNFEHSRERGEA